MVSELNFRSRWTSHQNTILTMFEVLLRKGSLLDVTLACEGKFIRAHRLVLSACSTYFQDLFNIEERKDPIVFLKDVKYSELESLVDYMYRGELSIPQNELPSLLSVAKQLKIRGLIDFDPLTTDSANITRFRSDMIILSSQPVLNSAAASVTKPTEVGSTTTIENPESQQSATTNSPEAHSTSNETSVLPTLENYKSTEVIIEFIKRPPIRCFSNSNSEQPPIKKCRLDKTANSSQDQEQKASTSEMDNENGISNPPLSPSKSSVDEMKSDSAVGPDQLKERKMANEDEETVVHPEGLLKERKKQTTNEDGETVVGPDQLKDGEKTMNEDGKTSVNENELLLRQEAIEIECRESDVDNDSGTGKSRRLVAKDVKTTKGRNPKGRFSKKKSKGARCSQTKILRRKSMEALSCEKCDRKFLLSKELTWHIKNECGLPPKFSCDNCDYRTHREYNFKLHVGSCATKSFYNRSLRQESPRLITSL